MKASRTISYFHTVINKWLWKIHKMILNKYGLILQLKLKFQQQKRNSARYGKDETRAGWGISHLYQVLEIINNPPPFSLFVACSTFLSSSTQTQQLSSNPTIHGSLSYRMLCTYVCRKHLIRTNILTNIQNFFISIFYS